MLQMNRYVVRVRTGLYQNVAAVAIISSSILRRPPPPPPPKCITPFSSSSCPSANSQQLLSKRPLWMWMTRALATLPSPPPPPPDTPPASGGDEDCASVAVVLREIRVQERIFRLKMQSLQKPLSAAPQPCLELHRSATLTEPPPPPVAPLSQQQTDMMTQQYFAQGNPPLSGVRSKIAPSRPDWKLQKIVYPRVLEPPQQTFKLKKPPTMEEAPLPKFTESNTQRVTTLLNSAIKPADAIASELASLKYKVDVKQRMLEGGQRPVRVEATPERPITTMMLNRELSMESIQEKGAAKEEPTATPKATPSDKPPSAASGDKPEEPIPQEVPASNKQRKWTRVKYTFGVLGLISTCLGGYMMLLLGAPKHDENGKVVLDKYSHMPRVLAYFYRLKDEMENYNKMIKEPSRERLLPDVLQPPYYQPPYTLIVEFTDLLVHPEWTYKTGWRFKKRPGVDQFLEALYTRFEVVVYTAQMGMTVFPILEALDGKNLISYKLVRDATNFVDGDHVKDLDKINRDLSKVVVVDWNPNSVKLHKCNLFQIPRWEGNDDDRTLYDLAAFLIAISEWEVQDVRTVLEYYAQFDNPLLKFKDNQLQVLRAAQI